MTTEDLQQLLKNHFDPKQLIVRDKSHLHKGHAGNTGGGHFEIEMISEAFEGKNTLARHRLVYQALSMPRAEIHALSMKLSAPNESKL